MLRARHAVAMGLIALALLTPAEAAAQVPPPAAPRPPFEAIAAGLGFTCGLTADQAAFCWGDNTLGQLGTGTSEGACSRGGSAADECSRTPVAVAGAPAFAAISAGATHACAIDTEGQVFCWGDNHFGQLGVPDTGEVCGRGDSARKCSRTPVHVEMESAAVSIGAGEHITCAADAEGAAWCWGMLREPGPMRVPIDVALAGISVGGDTVCGLDSEAGIHCWRWMEMSAGVTSPSEEQGWTSLTAGTRHACALDADGRAFCWGSDADGALGFGTGNHDKYVERPAGPVVGGQRFRQLVTSTKRTCGIDRDGALYCWGRVSEADGDDECLDSNGVAGTNECVTRPQHVQSQVRFRLVAVGDAHQCGLTIDGELLCWGANDAGQLGNGRLDATSKATPVRIGGVSADEMRRFDSAARVRASLPSLASNVLVLAVLVLSAIPLRRWWRAGPPPVPPPFTRRMGPRSIALVVFGWLVAFGLISYINNPPRGGGDVGLGLALLVMATMSGLVLVLSAAGTMLAAITLRNDRRSTSARVALALGLATLLAAAVGLYLGVVSI